MTQLLDQFGRPFPPRQRPETREIAAVSIRDRWSSYPSRGLTPQRLASIFYAADIGDLRSQAELFEEMEEKDLHLASVMQTRRLAVLGLDYQVEPASEAAADKKIADFCRSVLEDLDYEALATHLLGALGHGYAAAEPKWATGAQWTIGGFNLIHAKNISFINSLIPLVVTEDNAAGVEPGPFQLIYHRHLAKSGHDTRNGVLRVCGYMYLFKNYALKDWAAFNEIFGMPLRLGKYEPSASPADREALRQAIMNLGSDAAGVISKSTEIEFVEAAQRLSGTTNPYEVMANFCNREMSKAVLGQTLTTDTQGSTGTYAAGAVQAEVRRDLLEADAKALAKTIRMQLLRPLVGFNFGWDKPVPGFALLIQDSPDLKADSETYKNLSAMNVPIPLDHIYEHFGIRPPKDGEATTTSIKTPANLPAPGGPAPAPGGPAPAMKVRRFHPYWQMMMDVQQEGAFVYEDNGAGAFGALPQDQSLLARQRRVDAFAAQAAASAADIVQEMLAPVRHLIEQGEDLEAVKAELLRAFPDLQVEALAQLLFQARLQAHIAGRLEE